MDIKENFEFQIELLTNGLLAEVTKFDQNSLTFKDFNTENEIHGYFALRKWYF